MSKQERYLLWMTVVTLCYAITIRKLWIGEPNLFDRIALTLIVAGYLIEKWQVDTEA